mmetsp:Transcript_6529/g.9984  ORF Transcript_6529/g.9984 Transcript_6529/m.9984 type:complete len:134 (-) Transcript_6529:3147-3548(-)
MGTGTKCVGEDKLRLEGTVVHDCRAEIVARRSLLRWLYETADKSNSYTIRSNGRKPFELRPIELWLYSSQAPCGDAACFSRSDPQPGKSPCFTTKNHGIFRTKLEADTGGHPMNNATTVQEQSFDGPQLGNRI